MTTGTRALSTAALGVATADWGSEEDPRASRPTCLEVPPEARGIWISEDADAKSMAKVLCEECPVRRSCLERALDSGACAGVYGAFNLGSTVEVRLAEVWLGRRQATAVRRRGPARKKAAS